MILHELYLPDKCKGRPRIPLVKPTSITIHWIGPFPNQSVYIPRDYWVNQNMEASAHWIVKNEEVLATIPMDEVAWHCGSKGNYHSIGIEVVPVNTAGEFGMTTLSTLYELIDKIEAQFGYLELKRHYDWTGKDCPRYYTPVVQGGQERWEQFVALKKRPD